MSSHSETESEGSVEYSSDSLEHSISQLEAAQEAEFPKYTKDYNLHVCQFSFCVFPFLFSI